MSPLPSYSGDEAGTITDGADTLNFSEIEDINLGDSADSIDASGDSAGVNINAGGGDDTITGGSGDDVAYGGDGTDRFYGREGDNTFYGGDGSDRIYFHNADGHTVFEAGEDGDGTDEDVLDLWHYIGSGFTITYSGDEAATFASTDGFVTGSFTGVEDVQGTTLDDTFDASADTAGVSFNANVGDDTFIGGSGDDWVRGGDGDDTYVYNPGGGDDTIADFNTGNSGAIDDGDSSNNDFIDLSGFYDNLSELYSDQSDNGILNQSVSTDLKGRAIDWGDNDDFGSGSLTFTGASGDASSFTADNTGVVCFASGTALRTPGGEILIDELKIGDLVTTMDNGMQRIRWIGRTHFGSKALAANPKLRPVLIKRGVLNAERDLLVSRQHGVLIGQDYFARAVHLSRAMGGVRVANGKRSVTYFHIMFDEHQVVFSENVTSESFYPGTWALKVMSHESRASIQKHLPGVLDHNGQIKETYGPTARDFRKVSRCGPNMVADNWVLSHSPSNRKCKPMTEHSLPARAANCWKADVPEAPNCCFRIM